MSKGERRGRIQTVRTTKEQGDEEGRALEDVQIHSIKRTKDNLADRKPNLLAHNEAKAPSEDGRDMTAERAKRLREKLLAKGWDRVIITHGLVIAIQPGIHWACDTGSGYTKGHVLIVPLTSRLEVGSYEAEVKNDWEIQP